MTRVVNAANHISTSDDVFIGRPSKWGNPFMIGPDGRFTKQEYVYLWALFKEIEPELFDRCRSICGHDPVDTFLNIKSTEYYYLKENL